jgi:hypothetical protein
MTGQSSKERNFSPPRLALLSCPEPKLSPVTARVAFIEAAKETGNYVDEPIRLAPARKAQRWHRAKPQRRHDRSRLFRKSRILHFGEQNSACTLPANCVPHSRHCRNGAFGRAAGLTRCWHPAEQKWLIRLSELCMVKPHALHVRDVVALAASLFVRHAEQTGAVLVVGLVGSIIAASNAVAHRLQCLRRNLCERARSSTLVSVFGSKGR